MNYLAVALGGAIGSIFRYLISLIPLKTEFPYLTFVTNILGSILIGFIFGLSEKFNLDKNIILFWQTGVCGGFTTFSTFSLESYKLLVSKNYIIFILYVFLSILTCLVGVLIGFSLSKFLSKQF